MQHKSLFAALLCGALCLTACLKNEESPSVTQVRNAKASELESIAELNKATATATITMANADAKLKEAEAKLKEAEAKVREADAAYRLAEADAVKAATQLKLVEVQLKEIEVELAQVNVDIKKVELEAKRAELEAQKAEYEARIAAAEAQKAFYEGQLQIIAVQLETILLEAQAALIDAQAGVIESEAEYAELLHELEITAIENYEALRNKVIEVSGAYHKALRDLIEMEAELVEDQFQASKLDADLEDVIEIKNAQIEANNRQIARDLFYIQNLEAYRAEFLGDATVEDLKDLAEVLYADVLYQMGRYNEQSQVLEDAEDNYRQAYYEFARNYPILTVDDDGYDYSYYAETGIVYDYTNALLTEDEETGINLNALDPIDEIIVDYEAETTKSTSVDFFVEDLDLKDEWHSVKMGVYTYQYPNDAEIVGTEDYQEFELYRYYRKGDWPVGMEFDVQRYPELADGIAEDRYEWEDYEYTNINMVKFHPFTVNKAGFEAYIAAKQAILDNEYAEEKLALDGAKYLADWYVETFADAAASVEAALKNASDALDEKEAAYYESLDKYWAAMTDWINATQIGYDNQKPEQETLIALNQAISDLRTFIDQNKAQVSQWRTEKSEKESLIETKNDKIAELEQKDAEYKASEAYVMNWEAYREAVDAKEKANSDYQDAVDEYDDAVSDYNKQAEKVAGLLADYKDAFDAWWDAKREAEADPEDQEKQQAATQKKEDKDDAWDDYAEAKLLLEGPDEELEGDTKSYATVKKEAKQKMNQKEKALKEAVKEFTKAENKIKKFENQIAALEAEVATLQSEVNDIASEEKLGGYEQKLAELTKVVTDLEEKWAGIVDAYEQDPSYAAVEAAYDEIYGKVNEDETTVDGTLKEYEDARITYNAVYTIIYTARYYNDTEDAQYDYVMDEDFPGFEKLDAYDWYVIRPKYTYGANLSNFMDFVYYVMSEYPDYLGEEFFLIADFYDESLPMSMAEMVKVYHYFADEFKFPYSYAKWVKYADDYFAREQEEIDNIQKRLDKVMAGEDVYVTGIETANVLADALVEAQKTVFDEGVKLDYIDAQYEAAYTLYSNIINAAENGLVASLENEIARVRKEIDKLEKENAEWDDIFDKSLALAKLQAEIAILESEIEIQSALVLSWGAELEALMEELVGDIEVEEEPAEEPAE